MKTTLFAAALALGVFAFSPIASAHSPGGYGNGNHDLAPHWHKTYTPFGPVRWYGNGLHDLLPHHHTVSPWGGVRSYSNTPFGPTKSYNGYGGYRGHGGYGYRGYGYGGYGGW